MKLCLAMCFQNEAPLLRLHLPVLIKAHSLHWLVGLDGGSTDGSAEVFRSCGGVVFDRPFDWHFSEHLNRLITYCEGLGVDAILRLDPDELMWPSAIDGVARLLDRYKLLYLARFNFWRSRKMYSPYPYPDWQARAWVGHGVRLLGAVHEQIAPSLYGWQHAEDGSGAVLMAPDAHIYHYGEVRARPLQHLNYNRITAGQPALSEIPVDIEPQYTNAWRFAIPFCGPQPLDPDVVGEFAPWQVASERG